MAPHSLRILRRKGRLVLVETANPVMGVGYSVRMGTVGLWSGGDRSEAERQFDKATGERETGGPEAPAAG